MVGFSAGSTSFFTTINGTQPTHIETTNITYDNNPEGVDANYYIGRPTLTSTSISSNGETVTTKNEIEYYPNGLVHKSRNFGNTSENRGILETFQYDEIGNITTKQIESFGYWDDVAVQPRVTKYTYDSTKRFVATITTPEGFTQTNAEFHPIFGLVARTIDHLGRANYSVFDDWGKILTSTDYLSNVTSFEYEIIDATRKITQISPDGAVSYQIKDLFDKTIETGEKSINGNFSKKKFEYDAFGRLKSESVPYFEGQDPEVITTNYDVYGRKVAVTQINGLTTTFNYDGLTTTSSDGWLYKRQRIDAVGNVVQTTDGAGPSSNTINHTYFPDGKLKTTTYDGNSISFTYDDWGRKSSMIESSAGTYNYRHNAAGELVFQETPNGITIFKLDQYGRTTEKINSGNNTDSSTEFTYNSSGLLNNVNFSDNLNNVKISYQFLHDSYGRIFKETEARDNIKFNSYYDYDSLGRISHISKAVNGSFNSATKYISRYASNGDLIGYNDTNGNILTNISKVNAFGQIIHQVYGNSFEKTVEYDENYLPKSILYRDFSQSLEINLKSTFENVRGNLISRHNSSLEISENFYFDGRQRLIGYPDRYGVQRTASYDSTGRIENNEIGSFTYANEAKPYQITSIKTNKESTPYYADRKSGFYDDMETENVWIEATTQQPLLLSDQTPYSSEKCLSIKPNGSLVSATTATYLVVSNTESQPYAFSIWLRTSSATLNARIKLELTSSVNGSVTTDYLEQNAVATNSWQQVSGTFIVPATVNRLRLIIDNLEPFGVLYADKVSLDNANTIDQQVRARSATYNAFNSPVSIKETNVDDYFFQYDYLNERATMYSGKLPGADKPRYTKYYSADRSMELTYDALTNTSKFVVYVGGDPYDADVIYVSDEQNAEFQYLHRDYLGSIIAISNSKNQVVEQRHFDAWGNISKILDRNGLPISCMEVLDRGYTGHEHLQSIGLVHMNGRIYDPVLHTFMQPDNELTDPTNSQNYNKYAYCMNQPLKYVDINGEEPIITLSAVLIGALIAASSYTINAYIRGGDFSWSGLALATFLGAVGGAASSGIGHVAGKISGSVFEKVSAQAIMHGVSQGGLTSVGGGNFWSGFASGALASVAASGWHGGQLKNGTKYGLNMGKHLSGASSTLIFGTLAGAGGAALTGGNVWQGAATGAIVAGLNHVAHKAVESNLIKSRLKSLGISDPYASIPESNRVSEMTRLLEGDQTLRKLHKSVNFQKVKYDPDLLIPGRTAGKGREIVQLSIGPLAFTSYINLYQTLGHELVHAFQFYSGAFSSWEKQVGTEVASFLAEAEAYFWNWKQDKTTKLYWNEGYDYLKKYYEATSH